MRKFKIKILVNSESTNSTLEWIILENIKLIESSPNGYYTFTDYNEKIYFFPIKNTIVEEL